MIEQWEGIICSHARVLYFTQQRLSDKKKRQVRKGWRIKEKRNEEKGRKVSLGGER